MRPLQPINIATIGCKSNTFSKRIVVGRNDVSGLWERAGPSNNKKDRQSSHYKYHVVPWQEQMLQQGSL